MSVQAISCAFALRGISPSEKLVLLALANYADEHMRCWPSQETLARETELSERTVWGALKSLEQRRILSRQQRKRADGTRTTDVFTLHLSLVVVPDPLANAANSTRKSCEDQSQTLRDPVAPVATLTTFEPPVNHQIEPLSSTKSTRVPQGAFDEFWRAYPHKVGKGDARSKFAKAIAKIKAPDPLSVLLSALKAYIAAKPADRPWCNPATWLNQERWEDGDAPAACAQSPPKSAAEQAAEDAKWAAYLQRQAELTEANA